MDQQAPKRLRTGGEGARATHTEEMGERDGVGGRKRTKRGDGAGTDQDEERPAACCCSDFDGGSSLDSRVLDYGGKRWALRIAAASRGRGARQAGGRERLREEEGKETERAKGENLKRRSRKKRRRSPLRLPKAYRTAVKPRMARTRGTRAEKVKEIAWTSSTRLRQSTYTATCSSTAL